MAHSKRNTSRAVFTSYERDQLKTSWGSQRSRLTRESYLSFAACNLCLQSARDPVACAEKGDIFCRECIVTNLLTQKSEVKRVSKEAIQRENERNAEEREQETREKNRAIQDFERSQSGLGPETFTKRKRASLQSEGDTNVYEYDPSEPSSKRKFILNQSEIVHNAKVDHDRVRNNMKAEETAKEKLKSFWVPSLTPQTSSDGSTTVVKTQTVCPCSDPEKSHLLSLKTLVDVRFSFSEQINTQRSASEKLGSRMEDNTKIRVCPACSKALSSSAKAVLAVPCGHVICKTCKDQFMVPEEMEMLRCYVCNVKMGKSHPNSIDHKRDKTRHKNCISTGFVDIRSEGTGFAGGGKNLVKKAGVAFQC